MRRLVHELHRVKKSKSNFVKLMGAWPIRRVNIFMAGPARVNITSTTRPSCTKQDDPHDRLTVLEDDVVVDAQVVRVVVRVEPVVPNTVSGTKQASG